MSSSNELPAYFTEYLNEIAKKEGFIQHTLDFEAGSNHGDNMISLVIAVTIKGKRMKNLRDDNELHLMCKLLSENKARREFFKTTLLFEREVCVYNEILPIFEKFQIENNISTDEGFFSYPKCYLAVSDADKDHYVIIMENLKPLGYELWDKMKPIDFNTSSLFFESLGRLHGLSFALRDQKPDLFEKLVDLENIFSALIPLPHFVLTMTNSIDKAIDNLIREDEINLLRKIKENCRPIMEKLLTRSAAGRFSTFNHGDSWNNNFCFLMDEHRKPCKISFIDWQLSTVTSAAMDVSCYLLSSTTKELRTHYEELLKVYHNSLSTLVTKLGSDPSTLFPFHELKNELRQFGMYGVTMAPTLLQLLCSDSKKIVDLNSIEKDTKNVDFATLDDSSTITYRERISDGLQDANMFGWIDL